MSEKVVLTLGSTIDETILKSLLTRHSGDASKLERKDDLIDALIEKINPPKTSPEVKKLSAELMAIAQCHQLKKKYSSIYIRLTPCATFSITAPA